jgi:ubiquinone/menaquinone biosynthesis C-methylase UbiE
MVSGYRLAPVVYDTLIEPLLRGAREAGITLAPPQPGMAVLDVGCGTAGHLARYAEGDAAVVGVDRSRAMLRRAAARLGGRVIEGDALRLPLGAGRFDLAVVSMVLHELTAADRRTLLAEARRVTRPGGALLIIDYLPRPARDRRNRLGGRLAALIEWAAGGDHRRNYRSFIASGGLPALIAGLDMSVVASADAAAGTIGAYLVR